MDPLRNDLLLQVLIYSLALIFPSILYENFPMIIVEAFACCKPIIASNLGAKAEIIENSKTGFLFAPVYSKDFASKIIWAYVHRDEMK